ncbi:MAG: retron St85 family effector protein [Lysobacteraceae bacterium]
MQEIKTNPAFDLPREKLKSYFSRDDLFFSTAFHLTFVCGAGSDVLPSGEPSMRSEYIKYVLSRGDEGIVCIRAETATTELLRQLGERERKNLAHFEKLIAETVDSILVFPESPGSFAELGFFSAFDDISKNTIVAIKEEFQNNSFITLGPIHHISSVSKYKPVPIVMGSNFLVGFKIISNRLIGSDEVRPYRKRFKKHDSLKSYSKREQLAIIDEIIEVIGLLTEPDLKSIISEIFYSYDIDLIRMLISLLVAMGRVRRNRDGDIVSTLLGNSFMECDGEERVSLKARWMSAYEATQPESLEEIRRGV